jgi:hypothetical protein
VSEEYEHEPIPGLPEVPPEGESILWQGSPVWTTLALSIFQVGLVAAFVAVLIAWRIGSALWIGADVATATLAASWIAVTGAIGIGILCLLAYFTARTTVYTITSRRVAMRFGVALPLTINLPFSAIVSADLKSNSDGTADIALALNGNGRLAYLHLWPHARPWHVSKPQPMMRGVKNPASVANLLTQSLASANPDSARNLVQSPVETGGATLGRPQSTLSAA